jgi:hypothetical protein
VSELASLQGVIGGEYGRREGFPEPVCAAIASQYLGASALTDATAARLVVADQLDKLAGYLGVGLVPTGSSDPFGLRRACTLLIEIVWQKDLGLPPYGDLLSAATELYEGQGVNLDESGALAAFDEMMAARYEALLPDARYDLLDAALRSRTSVHQAARPGSWGRIIHTPTRSPRCAQSRGARVRDASTYATHSPSAIVRSTMQRTNVVFPLPKSPKRHSWQSGPVSHLVTAL